MPTPDRLTHRSPKPLVFLLVAVFAAGALVPSALAAPAKSASRAPSLRGLHPGETGPAVRKLQRMLSRLGYPVRVDGQFGPHTATMVRTLRADAGLDRSARVTQRFLRVLRRAQRGGPGDRRWLGIRRLRVGAQGKDVRVLQNDLTEARLSRRDRRPVRPCHAQERAPLRAGGRAAGRRRADSPRDADAQEGGPLGRHGGRGLAALGALGHDGRERRRRVGRHASPTSRPGRSLRLRRAPARSAPTASRSHPPAHPPRSSRSSRRAT